MKNDEGGGGEVGGFEREQSEDAGLVKFTISAKKSVVALEFLSTIAAGFAVGLGAWYLLRHHVFEYSYFRHELLLRLAFFAPPAIAAPFSLKRLYPILARRFEISRRFIRSEFFAGVSVVDTADMSKVEDVSMTRLGPVVSIVVRTRDRSTPVIRMDYVERELGERAFKFIADHAINSLTELRGAARREPPRVSR